MTESQGFQALSVVVWGLATVATVPLEMPGDKYGITVFSQNALHGCRNAELSARCGGGGHDGCGEGRVDWPPRRQSGGGGNHGGHGWRAEAALAPPCTGKSGGYSVITYYAGRVLPVFLLTLYAKGERANLSPAERNALRGILSGIAASY